MSRIRGAVIVALFGALAVSGARIECSVEGHIGPGLVTINSRFPVIAKLSGDAAIFETTHRIDLQTSLAIYSTASSQTTAQLIVTGTAGGLHCRGIDAGDTAWSPAKMASGNTSLLVGILYEGWHAYAAQTVLNQTFAPISVEAVIRSDGQLSLENMYAPGNAARAAQFYYQALPAQGPYCIYRRRAGDANPPLPDCTGITETVTRHAQLLVQAGVDYAILDSTNLPSYTPFSDVIQLRPAEVLAEEWTALRARGIATPNVAVWACVPTGANLYQYFLDRIYNNPNVSSIVQRDPATGKMLFFIVNNPTLPPDPSIVALIESNGGLNNIVTVNMWANFDPEEYSEGLWGFMSPCTSGGVYTTTIGPQCNQYVTTNSPLGTAVSVSPSYQLGFGSVPWGAPGKQHVGTFQKQFLSAMSSGAQNLMISSFNEFISQPQPDPYSQYIYSMGLEWDPMKSSLFVDTFGCSISRDIEPSQECGDAVYSMMQSCIRTWTVGSFLTGGADATCSSVAGETCCAADPASARTLVYTVIRNDNGDFMLSNNPVEVNDVLASGSWSEVCSIIGGVTAFCQTSTLNQWAVSGAFLLAPSGVPLYRCRTTAASPTHFFSTAADCEGQVFEYLLGYVAQARSSEFPRSLRRCYDPSNGMHFPSLDLPCQSGHQEAIYGFVH